MDISSLSVGIFTGLLLLFAILSQKFGEEIYLCCVIIECLMLSMYFI